MKYKVKDKNKYTKEVTCTVPWDDLKDSFNDEFNRAKANHTPQNGRKGKVFGTALEIFKKNYTPAIEATFAEKALNEYYQKILIETGLQPINRANPTDLKFKQGEELSFVLDFEVVPEIKLPNYEKKFKVSLDKYVCGDEDIDLSLKELQERQSTVKPTEKGAISGNFIMGDFQELDESGLPIIGKRMEKQYIKLGIGAFIDQAEKDMIGVKPDEKRIVSVNYGEDKVVKYEIDVKKVEEQVLPELNDDFAKSINPDIKSLEELTKKIEEDIQKSLDNDFEKRKYDEYIKYFVEKSKFSPPESMVNNYLSNLLEEYKKKNQDKPIDEEKLMSESREMGVFNVSWYLIKESLLDSVGVVVDEKELEEAIQKEIDASGERSDETKQYFNQAENKTAFKNSLINNKLFLHLDQFAVIKTKEKSTSELRKNKGQ